MKRLAIHYLAAFIILTLYGGQVCPYVESLTLTEWGSETIFIFSAIFIINFLLYRKYSKEFLNTSSDKVANSVILLFAISGLTVAAYNFYVRSFPIASGLKLLTGWLTIGFFIMMDMALYHRKKIIKYLTKTGQNLQVQESYASLTKKFLIFSILTTLFVMGTTFLVVLKDIDWILHESSGTMEAGISVLKEFAFIFIVFIGYATTISLSFTSNLRLYLRNQNNALAEVISGNLNVSVPVGSVDEFGHMAQYTNQMIHSLKERTEALQLTQDVSILSLASLAETRDNETGAHIMRTQRYVKVLAEYLSDKDGYKDTLTSESVSLIYKSAPLHDIGKVGIPDSILLKPGKLTDEEFKIMKRHPYYGKKALETASGVLGRNSFLKYAEEISFSHHEKWDGTGYPQQLKGTEIPISGRIMALADVYDALISKRVYKDAFSHEKAKSIILEGAGTHFDPAVVEAFVSCEERFTEIATKYSDENYKNASIEQH